MLTKEILIKEVEEHLNELALAGVKVVRVVGCGETEDDYYYKVDEGYGPRYVEHGAGTYYLSAVGKPFYLKEHLLKEEYERLDVLLSWNGAPCVEGFEWEVL